MFGTDLDSAYFDNSSVQQPGGFHGPSSSPAGGDGMMTVVSTPKQPTAVHVMQQQQQTPTTLPTQRQEERSAPTYDAHDLPNPRMIPLYEQQMRNSNTIKELQLELLKQKQQAQQQAGAPSSAEPLYDRYLSKKKDVFKLMSIALTVLFAISVHFVMGDLIKSYLRNNDFSYNKETLLKSAYPMSVLLMLWSLKVFNK